MNDYNVVVSHHLIVEAESKEEAQQIVEEQIRTRVIRAEDFVIDVEDN